MVDRFSRSILDIFELDTRGRGGEHALFAIRAEAALIIYVNPPTIAGPFGAYSQYSETKGATRIVHIAGQVGVAPDGTTPDSIEEQCVLAFTNLRAVLQHAALEVRDVTKLGVYMLERSSIGAYRSARQAAFDECKPPTTLVIVAGLANPRWKIEIEAYAAQ